MALAERVGHHSLKEVVSQKVGRVLASFGRLVDDPRFARAWAYDGQGEFGGWQPYELEQLLFSPPPSDRNSLADRLAWTISNPLDQENGATDRRIKSTDRIRARLLPFCHRLGIDTLTQIRLIHRAHMRGNEHYLLYDSQAKSYLSHPELNDGIAGIVRSQDLLPVEITIAGEMLYGVDFAKTPHLLGKLVEKMDELFPRNSIDPKVNGNTIYDYLSAFQWIFILIHPFYEANARTSEDAMHIFWRNRPDLKDTVRYLSYNGLRQNPSLDNWQAVMTQAEHELLITIARELGLKSQLELNLIKRYPDLLKFLVKRGMQPADVQIQYQQQLFSYLEDFIGRLDDIDFLRNQPVITAVAENLRRSSLEYHFSS